MSLVRIPAPKKLEPGMDLMEIDCIWDYLDSYVEEPNEPKSSDSTTFICDDTCDESTYCDDCWDDFDDSCWEENDWESDYRDAFEDDPEACWGREW